MVFFGCIGFGDGLIGLGFVVGVGSNLGFGWGGLGVGFDCDCWLLITLVGFCGGCDFTLGWVFIGFGCRWLVSLGLTLGVVVGLGVFRWL